MDSALVEVDFGDGAYGPTVMVVLESVAGVSFFAGLLRQLAGSAPGTTVELQDQPEASVQAAVFHLTMRVVERPQRRHLKRTHRGGFDWSCTPCEWETAALMVEALLGGPGHQYLTSEVVDDAVVEVCFGERGP